MDIAPVQDTDTAPVSDTDIELPKRSANNVKPQPAPPKTPFISRFAGLRSRRDAKEKIALRSKVDYEKVSFVYVSSWMFVCMNLITLGLFPYIWMWCNAYAIAAISAGRLRVTVVKLFAVCGFCVQMILPAALYSYIWDVVVQQVLSYADALNLLRIYVAAYFLLVFPMRCFIYINMRDSLRRAAVSWGARRLMASRTMSSVLKLLLLGSVYFQNHINRLACLGMPDLIDSDDIWNEASLLELLTGRERRPRRIRGYNRYHF